MAGFSFSQAGFSFSQALNYQGLNTATGLTTSTDLTSLGRSYTSINWEPQTVRPTPVGRPIPMPPLAGLWIAERAPGAKARRIVEVVCGSHIVCEGERHSTIKWASLKRYIEVQSRGWPRNAYVDPAT